MDKPKHTQPESENLTKDDLDMLKTVLQRVRGSYPSTPYRAGDFLEADAEA